MAYAGLRGAVALCLGLMLHNDGNYELKFREIILFHTSMLIILTILFNGLTMKYLFKKIKFET